MVVVRTSKLTSTQAEVQLGAANSRERKGLKKRRGLGDRLSKNAVCPAKEGVTQRAEEEEGNWQLTKTVRQPVYDKSKLQLATTTDQCQKQKAAAAVALLLQIKLRETQRKTLFSLFMSWQQSNYQ